ncbi:MAG TPA: TonB family protein [Burkholderiales bacterium]|nr:TonB family protein [Burkholderiales bacterium]
MRLLWIPAGDDRVLAMALGASLVLHALALSLHFKLPDALRVTPADQRLEVVLVNARTRERPARSELLAQANLDRGGTVDEARRARSPLPVTNPREPGRDLAAAERRVRELEARQQELLATAQAKAKEVAQPPPNAAPAEQVAPQPSGRDLADLALAAMRLQAQIDKQIDDYQKRPRKKFIGANAAEYRFAQYEEDWRAKVERVGTLNYPAEARGKFYGNLRLTVTIRADGSVESIELDRSSGLKILDAAAFKIVRMAGPYAAFPPAIRRDTDLLVITRTWFFGQGDKLWTE